MNPSWVFCLLLASAAAARPWNAEDFEPVVGLVQQQQQLSPLTKTIDSMTSRFSRALKTLSPSLTTSLSVASLAYVGYVASVMLFPAALREVGVPLLEDVPEADVAKSTRTAETSGLIDSLATELMKDMIGRTEAAVILRNTSANAVKDGMNTLKRTTRFINVGLGSIQDLIKKTLTALDPRCLARSMCQVGQFTSLHFPALGPVLRSVNTFELDEYSQALIDGTSIGDCSAVYFDCTL